MHITYIQSVLDKKENGIINLIQSVATKEWATKTLIYYRNKKDRRIYALTLTNRKADISYRVERLDAGETSMIAKNKEGTFMPEGFFNSEFVFGPLADAEIIGFLTYNENWEPIDNLNEDEKKALEGYGLTLNGDINWDEHQDITSVHYTELLSLIKSHKNCEDDRYYKKILKFFGE